ncbi:hypothetical protein [Sulfurimonas marina]|uniref:DUF721 domain-containing protein n=1 Tax=Sulfurimonas marina TaxID=2590551 RepID=A0A7M1AWW5_9BACT|nr:hypothetical protein [Sulfurimonas marina]QOP41930.1 hypothetical protein FJR03_09370 [Sulfurimonas marina]
MKNATDIIKIIQNQPQFSKLSHFHCIKKIQSLFNLPLQKMVKFAYIKNQTLFFVLNHPGAKQEFDNNIQSIKSALKFVTPEECKELSINDIRAFVTHTPSFKPSKPLQKETAPQYPERASGDISVDIQDERLNKLVKSIFDIIKEKNGS